MPTHRASLTHLSIEQLAEVCGHDRRTIRKRLADLEPSGGDGRSLRFRAPDALARLFLGPPVGGGRREITRGLLASMILPEAEWIPWRSPSLVPISDYFAELGIADERERAALHAIGFPIVAPAEGETVARTSPALAERWLTLLSLAVEALGGDGAVLANLGREVLRLEGEATA